MPLYLQKNIKLLILLFPIIISILLFLSMIIIHDYGEAKQLSEMKKTAYEFLLAEKKSVLKNNVLNLMQEIDFLYDKIDEKSLLSLVSGYFFSDNGYCWVIDESGALLTHPDLSEKIGKNILQLQDKAGKYFIREFFEKAKEGGGFVEYYWPKIHHETAEKKIAYLVYDEKRKWLVGAGSYFSDMANCFAKSKSEISFIWEETHQNILLFALSVLVLLGGLSFIVSKRLYKWEFSYMEKIEKQNKKLAMAGKIAHIGFLEFNCKNNKCCCSCSDSLYRIFGKAPGDKCRTYEDFLDLIYPEDRDKVGRVHKESVVDKKDYSIEYRVINKDGSVGYVLQNTQHTYDNNGNIIGSLGTVLDFTEYKYLELEHEKKKILLFHQAKLAQMGEMISNIAHQWKQPLSEINSILINMGMDSEKGDLSKGRCSHYIDSVENLTEHMAQTIEGFKNFTLPEREKEHFSAAEMLAQIRMMIEPVLTNLHIGLSIKCEKDIFLNAYKYELIEAVFVLLNNAKDILVERKIKKPLIEILAEQVDKHVVIKVLDNGGGVARENIDKIFNPYFTTKQEGGGAGIGLYMAKMIIEQSGGTLAVKNVDGKACFAIVV